MVQLSDVWDLTRELMSRGMDKRDATGLAMILWLWHPYWSQEANPPFTFGSSRKVELEEKILAVRAPWRGPGRMRLSGILKSVTFLMSRWTRSGLSDGASIISPLRQMESLTFIALVRGRPSVCGIVERQGCAPSCWGIATPSMPLPCAMGNWYVLRFRSFWALVND